MIIRDPRLPFSIRKMPLNTFIVLGVDSKNKTQLLYVTSNEKSTVSIDRESVLEYGPHCKCYPIVSATNAIVGSLLLIDTHYLEFKTSHVMVTRKSEIGSYTLKQAEGVGGLMTFIDEYDNVLIVPYDPTNSKLTVTD